MKRNKIIYLITILLVAGTGCEDFLDKNPLDSVSSQTFWETEEDALTGLAGVYYRLQENFLGYERVYLEGLTDNAYPEPGNGNQPGLANMATGSISPTTGGALEHMYETPYRVITSANYFLDNVDKTPLSSEQKSIYKGEVRFIRALAYFDLVQAFGGVVIYRHFPETLDDAKIAKSPASDVYAFIEEDLNFAEENLPDEPFFGHAVKGSAQALKARVLITQEKWEEALVPLQDVMNSGHFALAPDYAALFTTLGQQDEEIQREIIFATRYLAPNDVHRTSPGSAGMDIELGWWALLQPYEDLADEYEMLDGQPAAESTLYDPEDPYANRDPRLDLTLRLPEEVWTNAEGEEYTGSHETQTGFMMEKYVELARAPFTTQTALSSDQDYIHLRYADVLLMYAEAKNEVSGPDATVYEALNEVRSRPGIEMPPVDETRYNTQETLREFIRHERRVELALEGQRYNDLKRWRIAHIKLPQLETPNGNSLQFGPDNYVLPFPQSELDNNPKLTQNDEYK